MPWPSVREGDVRMRRSLPALLLLLALAPAWAGAQEAAPAGPAVVLRIAPLDELIGDAKYLVKQTQREEIYKQVEGILKSMTDGRNLEGVDTTKPIGLYATPSAKLEQSEVVVLLPVADEKAFLAFLKELNFGVEDDG